MQKYYKKIILTCVSENRLVVNVDEKEVDLVRQLSMRDYSLIMIVTTGLTFWVKLRGIGILHLGLMSNIL